MENPRKVEKREIEKFQYIEKQLKPYRNWAADLTDDELIERLRKHRDVSEILSEHLGKAELTDAVVGFLFPGAGDLSSLGASTFLSVSTKTNPTAMYRMFKKALLDTVAGLVPFADIPVDILVRSVVHNQNVILEVYYCLIDELYIRGNKAIDKGEYEKAEEYFEKADRYKEIYHEICGKLSKRNFGIGRRNISKTNKRIKKALE
jgi:hypothetical protein